MGSQVLGELAIYDLSGRRVQTLVSGMLYPGTKSVTWNGTDDNGRGVASGVYHYVLKTTQGQLQKKMTLIR